MKHYQLKNKNKEKRKGAWKSEQRYRGRNAVVSPLPFPPKISRSTTRQQVKIYRNAPRESCFRLVPEIAGVGHATLPFRSGCVSRHVHRQLQPLPAILESLQTQFRIVVYYSITQPRDAAAWRQGHMQYVFPAHCRRQLACCSTSTQVYWLPQLLTSPQERSLATVMRQQL